MELGTNIVTPLVCVFTMAGVALGYGKGAPITACTSQTPGHRNTAPQTSQAPYTVRVSGSTYTPGVGVEVTISGVFEGFMVQARDNRNAIVGSFSDTPSYTQTTRCSAADDTWTHTSKASKTNLRARWYPPTSDMGQVKIRGTVLQEFDTYWVGLESSVLTYTNQETTNSLGNRTSTESTSGACHIRTSVFSLSFALGICLLKEQLL